MKKIGTDLFHRGKDAESPTGKWLKELKKLDPWYSDIVPDVCSKTSYLMPLRLCWEKQEK